MAVFLVFLLGGVTSRVGRPLLASKTDGPAVQSVLLVSRRFENFKVMAYKSENSLG